LDAIENGERAVANQDSPLAATSATSFN